MLSNGCQITVTVIALLPAWFTETEGNLLGDWLLWAALVDTIVRT